MLEIYGRGYVIEHCMASFHNHDKEEAFKVYVTDALKVLTENTAKLAQGRLMNKRYIDFIRPAEKTATASEIKANIRRKIKLGGNNNGQ